MQQIIELALRKTVNFLPSELKVMPPDRWNESTFRYQFCRSLSEIDNEIVQRVECSRIDLVLRMPIKSAFIEFKFYQKNPKYDPYTDEHDGFKGGPGKKNLSEFKKCIEELAEWDSTENLFKYVVLVYADDKKEPADRTSFSKNYNSFTHPKAKRLLALPVNSGSHRIQCHLYEVT
jgi:hypothetical protein